MKKYRKAIKKKAVKSSRKRPSRTRKAPPLTSVPGTGIYLGPGLSPLIPPDEE